MTNNTETVLDLDAILGRLGQNHLQQCMAASEHPKGSPEWHRFNQGRWAFKEAAQDVNAATGYTRDIYGAWVDEWSPEGDDAGVSR